MLFSRAFFALMRRNLVYRRRHWISTILEVALPIFFMWFLTWVKGQVEDSDAFRPKVVKSDIPTSSVTPLTFRDYTNELYIERVCINTEVDDEVLDVLPDWLREIVEDNLWYISGINAGEWHTPFLKCDPRFCTENFEDASKFCELNVLGIVGINGGGDRAKLFENFVTSSYDFNLTKAFKDNQELEDYVTHRHYGDVDRPKVALAVVFDGNDPDDWKYAIRQNGTNYNHWEAGAPVRSTPDTSKFTDSFAKANSKTCIVDGEPRPFLGGSGCTFQYMANGVLVIQRLVNDFVMNATGATAANFGVAEAGVSFASFPAHEYITSGFFAQIEDYIPVVLILGWLYPVACMVSYITKEKEFRQKELMKMMSVGESDIGWSWFFTFLFLHSFTAVMITFMATQLYSNSDVGLLLFFWILLVVCNVVYCMAIASVTSKSTRAVVIGVLVYFSGVFLTLAVDYEEGGTSTINAISLHPIACVAYGLKQIGRLEETGVGLTGSTISFSENRSGYSLSHTFQILVLDSFLWGFLTWYLNRVIRPDYGQALVPWFLFTKSYWFPSQQGNLEVSEVSVKDKVEGIPYESVGQQLENQATAGESIEIHNLRKVFGDKRAVDGLNLSMYSGQITALLGHNGAGKTTTINMLTGAMAPTSGYATIAGQDIRTGLNNIRQDIGICLQHDCLFPNLTVKEHVQFFARLKGLYEKVDAAAADEQVEQSIHDVALYEKRDSLSSSLSGGMKRKLSVAMAFCGGSKVVLLDEPTSGMDPFSRRFTWNVIRQYRQDRCIILTTHFMDEADILGDRIAIMAEGQLRCAGSPLFLKKTYGVGYQLTIEKPRGRQMPPAEEEVVESLSESTGENGKRVTEPEHAKAEINDGKSARDPHAESDAPAIAAEDPLAPPSEDLLAVVQSSVGDASLLSDVGTELRFQLPLAASSQFVGLFEKLDKLADAGGVMSYGVSITTLDEVFVLVARGDTRDESTKLSSSRRLQGRTAPSVNLDGTGLFFRHIAALLRKRAANFRRDKKAWVCTTIIPSLFVLIGFIVYVFRGQGLNLEPMRLDMAELNKNVAAPQNPITINNPVNPFTCVPGNCVGLPYEINIFPQLDILSRCGSEAYKKPPRNFFGNSTGGIDSIVTSIFGDENLGDEECLVSEVDDIFSTVDGNGGIEIVKADVSTIEDCSEVLLATSKDTYESSQYGAIWLTRESDSTYSEGNSTSSFSAAVQQQCQIVTSIGLLNHSTTEDCPRFEGIGYVIQHNFTAIHMAPILQKVADEAILRYATNNPQFRLTTTIDPLPLTEYETGLGRANDAFLSWFLVLLSFPFIAAAYATFVVQERQTKAKHLQTVSGVNPAAYWISSYLWDTLNYAIPVAFVVAFMFIFKIEVFTETDRDVFLAVITTFALYGPASAGYAYMWSFMFKSANLCAVLLIVSEFIIAFIGSIAVLILWILAKFDPEESLEKLATAAKVTPWVLRVSPSFNLGKALLFSINIDVFALIEQDVDISAFAKPVAFWEIVFLAVQAVVYPSLAILLDVLSSNPRVMSYLCCTWLFSSFARGAEITTALPEDDDVLKEQDRVVEGRADDDLIVVNNLTKVYGNGKMAVNNMSLGIPQGECFGLLGINGAGKTTTMSMLTAEFPPTKGDATLAGFSIVDEPSKIRRRIGYCPQFDAHFPNMTGREHVELYASIKGVPGSRVKQAADDKLAEVGLSKKDSDRLTSNYSGGMRRRLSLACATIGSPRLVFLDECSTGVDPVARREIWQLISDMVTDVGPNGERTSVILTTHSMEECEALCPRIGIMANGRLRCLGSAQHLKNKFGQGFQVELKAHVAEQEDEDYTTIASALATVRQTTSGATADIAFTYAEACAALDGYTGDTVMSSMIRQDDPAGYTVWKDANSAVGVTLVNLATFCTAQLRMKRIEDFVAEEFPNGVLREWQNLKVRYEIPNDDLRISQIFARIEEAKDKLQLADYGVSQTSLEQVFNMHAAEAERLKLGQNDR